MADLALASARLAAAHATAESVARRMTAMVDTLRPYRFNYTNEDELQQALAEILNEHPLWDARREVRLSAHDRIDLLVNDIGVEVKVAGSAGALHRQITRYLHHDEVRALIVVTSRARHLALPETINGRPVAVLSIVGGGL